MATYIQRFQAIGDAIVNGTATATQLQRVAAAIGSKTYGPGFDALTNAQKAEYAVKYLRAHVVEMVKSVDAAEASLQATAAAAAAAEAEFGGG